MWQIPLGFGLGLTAAWFAHFLSLARERRADVLANLDRAIERIVAGGFALRRVVSCLREDSSDQALTAAAANVAEQAVGMVSAFASLRVRVGEFDSLTENLAALELRYEAVQSAIADVLARGRTDAASLAPALDALRLYEGASDEMIEGAYGRFGQRPKMSDERREEFRNTPTETLGEAARFAMKEEVPRWLKSRLRKRPRLPKELRH
jgi:hypothetical protein